MLGIIGAMPQEVAKLKERMEEVKITVQASMEFYQGKLENTEVVVVQAGIGKVNAACCTQLLISLFSPTAIINTGIAGSLKSEINIGDIVLSTDTVEHDVDAVAFGYELGQIPQMDIKFFPTSEKLRNLAKESCQKVNQDIAVFEGRIVSGDQFISSKEKKDWLISVFEGYATEMEGAAIAHAAWLNQVPCLIIRAISDKADDSAHMDYPEFEAKAILHSVNLMVEIAKRMDREESK